MKKAKWLVLSLVLLVFTLVSCPQSFKVTYVKNIPGETGGEDWRVVSTYQIPNDYEFPDEDGLWNKSLDNIKPYVDGKILLGWSENQNAVTPEYKINEKIPFTKDTTVYGIWEEGKVITATLNHRGATEHDSHNAIYYRTTPESKKGWFNEKHCQDSEKFDSILLPKYNKTFTFKSSIAGDNLPTSLTRNLTLSEDASSDCFLQWFSEKDPLKSGYYRIKADKEPPTSDIIIKSTWKEETQDGLLPLLYDTSAENPKVFKGWRKSAGELYLPFYDEDKTVDLTASWVDKDVVPATFDQNPTNDEKNLLARIFLLCYWLSGSYGDSLESSVENYVQRISMTEENQETDTKKLYSYDIREYTGTVPLYTIQVSLDSKIERMGLNFSDEKLTAPWTTKSNERVTYIDFDGEIMPTNGKREKAKAHFHLDYSNQGVTTSDENTGDDLVADVPSYNISWVELNGKTYQLTESFSKELDGITKQLYDAEANSHVGRK